MLINESIHTYATVDLTIIHAGKKEMCVYIYPYLYFKISQKTTYLHIQGPILRKCSSVPFTYSYLYMSLLKYFLGQHFVQFGSVFSLINSVISMCMYTYVKFSHAARRNVRSMQAHFDT